MNLHVCFCKGEELGDPGAMRWQPVPQGNNTVVRNSVLVHGAQGSTVLGLASQISQTDEFLIIHQ